MPPEYIGHKAGGLKLLDDVAQTAQASVDWSSPYTKVARLDIPCQPVDSIQGRRLTADAEQSNQFDPWIALSEHRPLGEVMRARRVVYFASEQGRNAL